MTRPSALPSEAAGLTGLLPPDLADRLDGTGPLGVAVSGGGDSVALLYLLAEWTTRPLHVFCVDHGLNPLSGEWTRSVEAHAMRAGARFSALHWTGDKPATGLSAAARMARHRLLADAARAQGVRVLCLAHTRDDLNEAAAMRALGSNVASPRDWSPSPVWPEGRGVFLSRPLLGIGRETLRDWLRSRGIAWIDDPSNINPASLRARVRRDGAGEAVLATTQPLPDALHDPEGWSALGLLRFPADVLEQPEAARLLATAAVCAGGGDRLPRGDSVAAVIAALANGDTRTLAGARLWSKDSLIYVVREAGDLSRRPRTGDLWDGRFELEGQVISVAEARGQLCDDDLAKLKPFPPALRAVLPVWKNAGEGPVLALPRFGTPPAPFRGTKTVTGWVAARFAAAAGHVTRESDLA